MDDFLALDSLSVQLAVAFSFGMAARMIGMAPMLGFLLAGFVLNEFGVERTEAGERIAEFGVLLLLFVIGLKLKPALLAEKTVLGGALGHMLLVVPILVGALWLLGPAIVGLVPGLGLDQLFVIAFALSFSSTVFTVKVFEEKGELGSVHGKLAVGILIIQDLAAVGFLVSSAGAMPSLWALALVLLWPLSEVFGRLLDRAGHGELIPLAGLFAVMVLGAASFKAVGLKPDLGALVLGMLMGRQARSKELADSLLAFKDVFLIGFFLNIGLGASLTVEVLFIAAALVLLLPIKAALFFLILVALRLRARTALLAAAALSTYSEFGLIVGAVAAEQGIIPEEWLLTLALALATSFLVATPINAVSHDIYARFHARLRRFEAARGNLEDKAARVGDAEVVIFGMGRLGSAVYRDLTKRLGGGVVGVETDKDKVDRLVAEGWNVVHGDATDSDFWRRAGRPSAKLRAALLAMPEHHANMYALEQIRSADYKGFVAALARYPDQVDRLREAGADIAFDVYGEAGIGFAKHVARFVVPPEEVPAREPQEAGDGSAQPVPGQ